MEPLFDSSLSLWVVVSIALITTSIATSGLSQHTLREVCGHIGWAILVGLLLGHIH